MTRRTLRCCGGEKRGTVFISSLRIGKRLAVGFVVPPNCEALRLPIPIEFLRNFLD
jgi:hypothetical protein